MTLINYVLAIRIKHISVIKKASMDDDDPIVHEVCIYFQYLPTVMYSYDIVSPINMC